MNRTDAKYTTFALTREMLESPGVLTQFDVTQAAGAAEAIRAIGKLFMTGEGSSRIFPAKNAIAAGLLAGWPISVASEACCQAGRYDLADYVVFAASNSGRTQEVVSVVESLRSAGHANCFGLTATPGSKLENVADKTYVLDCGSEDAVAATKSLMAQAVFYQAMLSLAAGNPLEGLDTLAEGVEEALTMEVPDEMVRAVAGANVIYFVGYNDGVAEELTLKANEVVRKKSDFLEGTYAFHGAQEVMDAGDVAIIVDPIESQEPRYRKILGGEVGLHLFAIASRETAFPTLRIPDAGALNPYVQLAAGWNVLVEAALSLNIDLDKPERARKVADDAG